MTIIPDKLYEGQPGSTATLLYTSPANTRVTIIKATACNDTTTAKYLTVYLVPSGGTAGAANLIYNQKVIGSRETKDLSDLVPQVLDPGDMIYALAEAADQITVHISGMAKT